ncbi:MAG: type IV pilus modification PilV family protein [Planctomycetota bacterium]|jgi:prepilin-type N-terminal cleavage/methylation domain-containing protein
MSKARGARGFTLIEILVAMMIFLTGMTGLLALMTTGLALHRDGLVLSRATADLDGIAARIEREVAAGRHYDAEREAFVDVEAESLEGGTWYAVHFRTPGVDEPQVVEIRVAGSVKGLATARPVPRALGANPSAAAIDRFRRRERR